MNALKWHQELRCQLARWVLWVTYFRDRDLIKALHGSVYYCATDLQLAGVRGSVHEINRRAEFLIEDGLVERDARHSLYQLRMDLDCLPPEEYVPELMPEYRLTVNGQLVQYQVFGETDVSKIDASQKEEAQ